MVTGKPVKCMITSSPIMNQDTCFSEKEEKDMCKNYSTAATSTKICGLLIEN
jgi:hypothetical protein